MPNLEWRSQLQRPAAGSETDVMLQNYAENSKILDHSENRITRTVSEAFVTAVNAPKVENAKPTESYLSPFAQTTTDITMRNEVSEERKSPSSVVTLQSMMSVHPTSAEAVDQFHSGKVSQMSEKEKRITERLRELKERLKGTEADSAVFLVAKPKTIRFTTQRGSKYRGVSKNGKKWQVSGKLVIFAF